MAMNTALGLWALLGLLLALLLPGLFKPDFEASDRDYVREGSCNAGTLENSKFTCATISEESRELFGKEGVVVLRQAFDPAVIAELAAEVKCRMKPKPQKEDWALSAPNVWMDSELFAKFVLHKDSPLGCLAAQLIPNASTIRYGHEEVTLLLEGQNGSVAWGTDAVPSNLRDQSPLSVPLIRFFLPLGPQNLSNLTGGSLNVLPMSAYTKLRDFFPPCFEGRADAAMKATGELKGDCQMAGRIAFAPALALGDILLYSPLVPHSTQKLLSGARLALQGSLYEPKLLVPWVQAMPTPRGMDPERFQRHGSMRFDVFCLEGAACWDDKNKMCHHNINWQSAATQGISEQVSPCFPQVYPHPEESEVAARFSNALLNPSGPSRANARWLLYSLPVVKASLAPAYWLLDRWYK
ncbi:unnamed protein product [Symbiodinium natans]|uniref:Uncharacterized protein n=1 Tax=Symbiodinium natans TaxID=878477 RepID=A0A812JN70_9DINO|nr:unnamed protein product [Symbiodinium natans]